VSSARQILRLVSGAKVDLTQRERQVIREVAAGKSNFAIARALGVTENTIKGHLVNIFEKLGLSNRVQVASYAFENGLAGPASEAAGLEVA
jgi:two-component system nitrate/nitrite response regulator NarL